MLKTKYLSEIFGSCHYFLASSYWFYFIFSSDYTF